MRRGGQVSGLVTLVTVFCALSLCVFTMLSLSASKREMELSQLTAERAAEYYALDARASEWLAGLDPAELPEGWTAELTLRGEGTTALEVSVRRGGNGFEILRWQTVYAGDWEPEENLQLFDFS